MLRLLFVLVITLVGLSASALPRAAADGSLPAVWPALLNCPDVNANGYVGIADVGFVVSKFGTNVVKADDGKFVPGPDYMLLYDVDGGGSVEITDIGTVVARFGDSCPLIETQVAEATLAMAGLPPFDSNPDFRNWDETQAAGFATQTQYVPAMGIHVSDGTYTSTFDNTDPIGMVYKQTGGTPDVLIGAWFVVPVPEVCFVFGIDPTTCSSEEPVGFDGEEDNTDLNPGQRGWHTHTNLCFILGPSGPSVIEQGPGGSHEQCKAVGGVLNFPTYGYMIHLYNFIPNPDGRFLMWNFENIP